MGASPLWLVHDIEFRTWRAHLVLAPGDSVHLDLDLSFGPLHLQTGGDHTAGAGQVFRQRPLDTRLHSSEQASDLSCFQVPSSQSQFNYSRVRHTALYTDARFQHARYSCILEPYSMVTPLDPQLQHRPCTYGNYAVVLAEALPAGTPRLI